MKNRLIVPILLIATILGCTEGNTPVKHTFIITSDFGSVRRCNSVEEVNAVADTMISAQPDIMVLDLTANGLVNYRSDVGFLAPGSNFDAILAAGHEPASIIIDKLTHHDITVLANVRMNDHHGRLIQWTPWERENRQWSLAEDTGARDWKSIGALRQMDYAVPGVRDYRLSILEEIVEKFNVDGLQLDFGRTAPFVSEPKAENAKFMTEYVRRVRQLLDETTTKRKREQMLLGVILPWDIEFCRKEGLEVQKWIEEDLIDYVSPGEWYYADWNIPLDGWRRMTAGTQCKLYPFTPGNVSPYQEFEYGEPSLLGDNHVLDPAKIRAISDNFWAQHPDGFAFYNFYTFDFGDYYPKLRTWTHPGNSANLSRHYLHCRKPIYHPNELETFDIGVAFKRVPLDKPGDKAAFPFLFSTDISKAETKFRYVIKYMHENDVVAVRLNGTSLTPDKLTEKRFQPDGAAAFDIQIGESDIETPLLQMGENILEFELKSQVCKPIEVGEFEFVVQP